ncbi:hypothetical protein L226DRAFT_540779 [Lentinus tigrinus ALCF2SS1-7]|uniref:Uncharacterized protein n=1 Tax=Lentinus tigrinus ALCF2SS1-6 TaxID=1328759 RepID=A0A5C2RNR8_9APHY|nr:hypothetical protein L227DRAFT_581523 [Lentinus tigrinus ALCF2SS1-6]RPD68315.1 hypothetical protein L226DRAFT_540779 [Lentinus tigrinus ALCF2SS1-7]
MASGQPGIVDERLVVGGIYIILFLRTKSNDQPDACNCHWGLYHHIDPMSGVKYHIKNMGVGWIADHGLTRRAMGSMFLIGLLRIGHCAPQDRGRLQTIVESFPLNQVPPGYGSLTCITWTLHIVNLFRRHQYVRCDDLSALEQEATNMGMAHWGPAYDNVQPRPISDSRVCKLA